jgi:P-type conjugative transfer protein TrbJ
MNKSIFTLVLSLLSGTAQADKIVFDPTNFLKNSVTAAQTAKQSVILTNQLMTQVDQYRAMLVHLQKLPSDAISLRILGRVPGSIDDAQTLSADVYSNYQQLSNNLSGLSNAYQSVSSVIQDATRLGVLSGQSVEQLLEGEVKMKAAGRQSQTNYASLFDNLGRDIDNYKRRSDGLAERLPSNSGLMEGLGTLGAQNHIVIDQLSNLVANANAQAKANSQKQALDDEKGEYDARYIQSWEAAKAKARKQMGY